MSRSVPMTTLIVSHNEAHLIGDRLRELDFCDDLIVVDVASSDGTAAVAKAHGARVVPRPFARIAELVHPHVIDEARNDLVILPDPDERVPPALAEQLAALPGSLDEDVGIVIVPRIYYFRDKPLRGTIWGGLSGKRLVARRSGAEFVPAVHYGLQLKPGYRIHHIDYDGKNAMHHLWASGYRQFIRKHIGFVRIEGAARALLGEITGFRALARTPWRSFNQCFVKHKGYRDGMRGFLLSTLYALYRTGSDLSLIIELRRRRRQLQPGD